MSRRMDVAKAYEKALFSGNRAETGSYFTDDIVYWVARRSPDRGRMARPRGGARCPLEPRARTGRRRLGIRGRLARLVRGGRSGDGGAARALVVEVRPQGRDGPADVLHP